MAAKVIIILVAATISVLISISISAVVLYFVAQFLFIDGITYSKSFKTAAFTTLICLILSFVFSPLGMAGTVIAFLCGFVVMAIIIMRIFEASFGKALSAAVLSWLVSMILSFVIYGLLFGFTGGLNIERGKYIEVIDKKTGRKVKLKLPDKFR